MRVRILSLLTAVALPCGLLRAQAPSPVIVPPATSSADASSDNLPAVQSVLKMLQEMKATNEETLRKQSATLEQLDELEKAVDQIRILTKRS